MAAPPSYSSQPYPYKSIHGYLRQIFEAFGPDRSFWGTDITRMPCSYRQCVTMVTEELPWLKGRDLERVMGGAVVDWLGWGRPAGACRDGRGHEASHRPSPLSEADDRTGPGRRAHRRRLAAGSRSGGRNARRIPHEGELRSGGEVRDQGQRGGVPAHAGRAAAD